MCQTNIFANFSTSRIHIFPDTDINGGREGGCRRWSSPMKELRRHQSGWVITFLAAVRNDWQSKLVLPREGGRESRATEKCTHSVLFLRDCLVNRFPRILFRSPAFLHLPSLRSLPALFPSTFSRRQFYFLRLSLSLSRGTFISFLFSQNEARRAENRVSLYT